jgi:putative salt-induced outer membrane protein YdiY
MTRNSSRRAKAAGLVIAALAPAAPAAAQDAPAAPKPWSDVAEFSYVATAGNAEASTLGFKNTLGRKWERSAFELKAGGIRAEATTTTRTVVAGPAIDETSSTSLTAESYFLNGRFDRKIGDRVFWFAGVGWDRNRFAGIQNRYSGAGGVGNTWVDTETTQFRTDYAVTFTRQEDIAAPAGADDTFLGVRFSWKYVHKFGAVTTYGNDLSLDDNLDDTTDFRADMTNSVAVAMSARLALKVSLQVLYDNQPSFESIADPGDLLPPAGPTALAELDDLDTVFTSSLVISF